MKSVIAVCALALGACTSLAPKFQQPAVEVPARYKELAPGEPQGTWKAAQPADGSDRGKWWQVFDDPVLERLETEAIGANQSLKAAAARVAQARAILGIATTDRLPQATAGIGVTRQKQGPLSLGQPEGTDIKPFTVWRGLVTASYEVDLFGRVSDSIAAARRDLEANEATLRSVQLALQADVAQTYFALRASDEELGILRDTLTARTESARLQQRRFDLGDISELDLSRARTELAQARNDALALERQRAQIEHGLAVLLGKPPSSFSLEPAALAAAPPSVPAGLPSSLLERRPDIAAAQRAMAAANARIGVARSAFFPQLRLTAQGGLESGELGDLFKWSNRTWALGPLVGTLLSVPLFAGQRNQAALDRAMAVLEESVADYRQRVLAAFAEVEDTLVAVRTLAGQADATRDATAAAANAYRIAAARYREGASSYLEVLDAQRTLLAIRRQETQVKGARATAAVVLIRALGGGWDAAAPAPAVKP